MLLCGAASPWSRRCACPSAAESGGRFGRGSEAWQSYSSFNAGVAWTGLAIEIDPQTAIPGGSQAYLHYVAEGRGASPTTVRTTTSLTIEPTAPHYEEVGFEALDVDLDGSYSAQHPDGLALASLLLGNGTEAVADSAPPLVLEHSLATSDNERRRLLLVYDADSRALHNVLLLVESRRMADEEVVPVVPIAAATLFSLLGSWAGDACVRSVAQSSSKARGFGHRARRSAPAEGGVRTAVFKARLSWAWDGHETVARRLEVASPTITQLSKCCGAPFVTLMPAPSSFTR